MKKSSVILCLVATSFILFSCNNKVNTEPRKVTYDRDVCYKCKMQLVDPYHSAQIINAENGSYYIFDDLGCAILWLDEINVSWKDSALIYITDGKDGSWIEHKQAYFATGYKTPMSYGIAAFDSKDKVDGDKSLISYEEAKEIIIDIRNKRSHNRMNANH